MDLSVNVDLKFLANMLLKMFASRVYVNGP